MAKHKKTRKQKIIADYRHSVYTLENKNLTTPTPAVAPVVINVNSYSYVINDVVKTGALTSFIIAGELILFFLLKNHIITLPKISY